MAHGTGKLIQTLTACIALVVAQLCLCIGSSNAAAASPADSTHHTADHHANMDHAAMGHPVEHHAPDSDHQDCEHCGLNAVLVMAETGVTKVAAPSNAPLITTAVSFSGLELSEPEEQPLRLSRRYDPSPPTPVGLKTRLLI